MKLLLGKHELALQKLAKNYSIEHLTTEGELVLPTFKSWTDLKILEYLTLRLLFSLWNIYHSTTAYFFDPPCMCALFMLRPGTAVGLLLSAFVHSCARQVYLLHLHV